MSMLGRKLLMVLGLFLALWLGTKFVLPVALPFLAGGVVALAAEPLVGLGVRRLKLPRALASGIGVTVTLLFLVGLLLLAGALLLKELGKPELPRKR